MLLRSALTLCLLTAVPALAERPRVAVVKSSPLTAYAQVVAGFSAEVKAQAEEFTLEEGAEGAAATLKKVAAGRPALVLAIGPAAAVGARREFSDVPVLFAMVPYYEKYELEGSNTTGIALTSDLSLELSALRAVQPKVKRVGVLEDPRYSKGFVEAAAQAAQSRGLTLVPLEIDAPSKVDKALSAAKGRVDALVIISDKTVGNAAVVERLLAWSLEEKLPAVGLASAQVKQGALFALAPAPLSIGQQAGRLANRVLVEKVDPGALAVANPEGLELHVNLTTARKLGAPDAFALDVVTFAARQGLTVRVVE
ncbi:MAG: ABC transporter substrate-binding protein [Myxococcota bacterium]